MILISLFKDLLKCVGRKAVDGKSKGGIKSHSVINADEKVPSLLWFSPATTHDHQFLKKLKCDEHMTMDTMITKLLGILLRKTQVL